MKKIKDLIAKFAFWLLRKVGATALVLPPSANVVLKRAKVLTDIAESVSAKGTSGEYKRSGVYGRMIKEFPKLNKRDIGLIIELAVRDV